MPAAVVAVAWFVGDAIADVGAAVGLSGIGASIGAFAANGILALGFASGVGAGIGAWGTAIALGSAVASLATKVPQPASAGVQLENQNSPLAGIPIVFGRTAVGGNCVYRSTNGPKNIFLDQVIVLSAGPIDGFESFTADSYQLVFDIDPTTGLAKVIETNPPPNVPVPDTPSKLYLNNNFCMKYCYGVEPEDTVNNSAGLAFPLLDDNTRLSGLANAIQHLTYNTTNFPGNMPSMQWVIRGTHHYDPRQDSTFPGGSGGHRLSDPSTYTYSENPYVVALNFIFGRYQNVTSTNQRVWGLGATLAEVDVAAFIEGANVCDANNWKIGGAVSTSDDPYSVLTSILQAGGGVLTSRGAQFSCIVNCPKTSIFTLTASDVVGTAQIVNTTAWKDRKNTVTPYYREEAQQWAMWQGASVTSSNYVTDDAGETKNVEIQYTLVQNATQAAQLARYDLENSREYLTFTLPCKPHMMLASVGDCITVDLPEVATPNQKCLVVGRAIDPQTLQVTLTLRSETDGKQAFALGETGEAPDGASLQGTYDASNPSFPTSAEWEIVATSIASADSGGVVIPALVIRGAVADQTDVAQVVCEYRVNDPGAPDDADWITFATGPPGVTGFDITSVTQGVTYQASISHRSVVGVISDRLILGPATAGSNEFPWDSLTNKPVWADDALAIIAEYIKLDKAESTVTLAEVMGDLTLINTTVAGDIATAQGLIDTLDTTVNDPTTGLSAKVTDLETSTTDLATNKADASTVTALAATVAGQTTSIDNLNSITTDGTFATASSVSALSSTVGTNAATVTTFTTAQTTTNSSVSSTLSSLTSTVGAHTSSISTLNSVTGGLSALATLTVNGSGGVSGYEVYSGGGASYFHIVADNFAVVNTSGGGNVPFMVDGSGNTFLQNTVVDGNLMVAGTIYTEKLVDNAATVPSVAVGSATYGAGWGTDLNVSSQTIYMSDPGYIYVDVSFQMNFTSGPQPWDWSLWIGGGDYNGGGGTVAQASVSGSGMAAVSAGTYTATLYWSAASSVEIQVPTVVMTGYKK